MSAWYDRAGDKFENLPLEVIKAKDGALAIAKYIYKLDALSVISNAFSKFQPFVTTARGGSETFRRLESRFNAAISKYHAVFKDAELPSALLAFLLL